MARWLATWWGCGYAPVGPGTVGSAAALLIAIALHYYAGWEPLHFALLAGAWFLPAVWAAGQTAVSTGKSDPGIVVIDEVVGQWLTLAGATSFNWRSWVAAFLLFRVLDITKPPPIRRLERLHGGAGIVCDDVLAGVYGAVLLYAAGRWHLY